jgi:MYXO-CTERM domain-containing protein
VVAPEKKGRKMNYWTKLMMVAVAAMVVGLSATSVSAECESDEDCGTGMTCVTYEYETPDCEGDISDCPDGDEECLAKLEEEIERCESTEVITESYCEPGPCETDADCGENMVCVEYVDDWCSGVSNEECDENGDCTTYDEEPVCETEVYKECSTLHGMDCETDADCGDELVCVEFTAEWCSGGGDVVCDESGDCTVIEEEIECGSEVFKECMYQYEAPCEADADCGEGFSCVPEEICTCIGGDDMVDTDGDGTSDGTAGVAPKDPAVDEDEPMPVGDSDAIDCSCEPTGTNRCELQEIDCEDDADCPAGMICAVPHDTVPCVVDDDGNMDCPDVEPTSQGQCSPEGWYGDKISAGDRDMEGNDDTEGDGSEEDSVSEDTEVGDAEDDGTKDDDESEPEDTDPDEDDSEDNSEDDDPEEDPLADNAGPKGPQASDTGGGSCSVVAPAAGSSSAPVLLALLGLLAFVRRRP